MEDNKILVSDSKFLECVDEIATQITCMAFGADTWMYDDGHRSEKFSEEAQDFYNESFNDIETLINNTLNVWNKARQ